MLHLIKMIKIEFRELFEVLNVRGVNHWHFIKIVSDGCIKRMIYMFSK